MDPEQHYHSRLFSTAISSLLVIVFVIAAVVTINYLRAGQTEKAAQVADQSKAGSISLIGPTGPVAQGQEFTITVVIDSAENPVVGFDVDLPLPSGVRFTQAESLNSDFTLRPTEKGNRLLLTGYKGLSVTGSTRLSSQNVAEVTLVAVKAGSFDLEPAFEKGTNKTSNLIDEQSKNILSTVTGVTVEVE